MKDMKFLWDKQKIGRLFIQAAQHALTLQKNLEAREKGIEKDLYTDADVDVEQLFMEAFDSPQDGRYVIGEETVFEYTKGKSLADFFSATAFVVDPIDGTLNYFSKLPNWAISVGLVREGEIVEGAIMLPELRELFISEGGTVHYKKFACGVEHLSPDEEIAFDVLENPKPSSRGKHCLFVRSYGSQTPHLHMPFHVNRSSVYSATKVLTGHYWGYISKAKIWDLAGCIGLFRVMNKPLYYVENGELKTLPFAILEEQWEDLLSARYDIIFAHNKEDAQRLVS